MNNELVWCVPREAWNRFAHFEGFQKDEKGSIYRFLLNEGKFHPRIDAEHNHNLKQVIPQGLLRYQDYLYVNQRLPKQTDDRLLYAYSLGLGGHLNPEDDLSSHMDLIQIGLHREMAEEAQLPLPFSPKFIGITNDEQSEISSLHVGVWFEIQLVSNEVVINETEKIRGFWSTYHDLSLISSKFESWAKLIYENYL